MWDPKSSISGARKLYGELDLDLIELFLIKGILMCILLLLCRFMTLVG